ncbi:hypothetical protein H8K90_08265 [Winogradskyella echinorum]|uniref:Uncharacterized protein n=1 Tax=Winogradskyella echinorum TaxID=538189 RepID=A0ABR6Y0T4_9FLAO|nr:hypothetical protein [Winogradskyella echinorum]MBC3846370.1 hypothetical protein [Winogradskyella echinorum]MBC5750718.1 hypothetical protein [Winogradskyella echinorum]
MKTKYALFSAVFFLMISMSFAQKKDKSQSIISGKVNISKYHNREELKSMKKGDLLVLYIERIEVIVNILPNIAFATKPGVTMESLGIPETKENKKALEENIEASDEYFDSTIEFQKKILPYSDTTDLIAAILFYEATLKSLHTYDDFKKE